MKSLAVHTALLGILGALVVMGTVATTVPAAAAGATTAKPHKCFVDEGNGRRTPCDAMVKRKKTKKG